VERHTTFRFTVVTGAGLDEVFRRHAGARRFAYNQCLSMVKAALDRRNGGEVAKVPWSGFDLINAFNAWKVSPDAGRMIAIDSRGGAQMVATGLPW
jgi:putative transposase